MASNPDIAFDLFGLCWLMTLGWLLLCKRLQFMTASAWLGIGMIWASFIGTTLGLYLSDH